MPDEKPIHVPRERYPEAMYPPVVTTPTNGGFRDEDEVHLLDYWRVLVARRWTVLAVLVTVVAVTLIWTLKQIPIYQATVTIQIDRENFQILTFKDIYEVEVAAQDALPTQFEVLKARSLARRVIEDLRLDQQREVQPAEPGFLHAYMQSLRRLFVTQPPPAPDEPDRLRPLTDAYVARLKVTPIRQARLVQVSFESPDPELAARIINAHARHFIEQNLQFKLEATQIASDFLSQQLVTLRANLEKAEERLLAYSREHNIVFTDGQHIAAIEKLQQLEGEYTRVQAERFQKESYVQLVRTGRTDALPQMMNSGLIPQFMSRLEDLRREGSDLAVTFSPEYPRRKRIRSQIEEVERAIRDEKARIVQTVQAEYVAITEREKLLASAVEEQGEVVNRINQEIIQYNILKREVDSNKQLYDGLLTRLKEAGVSAGLRASNIRVLDRAEVPRTPVRPSKTSNLLLSLVVGLMLGVGLAFFQEYLDNSIRSPDDVTRYLNVPTLGMVPKLESLLGKRAYGYGRGYGDLTRRSTNPDLAMDKPVSVDLITHEQPGSLMSEAYRSVRTSLLLSSPDHPPRTILVTSATSSEGKTVTAVNLAISLTQAGSRVILVDTDMRKPRLHAIFSVGNGVGLSTFLAGSSTLKDVIYETPIPNLLVIPCGTIPPNPAELIVSNRFRRMMQVLREYFDYVVLDSPPLAHVSDPRILAATTDSTILVVKASATSRYQVRHAIDHLVESHARIAGALLNDVDVRLKSAYYTYYSYYPAQDYHDGSQGTSQSV